MIDSPIYQDIFEEAERLGETRARRQDIARLLTLRFGAVTEEIADDLQGIDQGDRLNELFDHAAQCPDLTSFRERLSS
jgi:hypothetical protein